MKRFCTILRAWLLAALCLLAHPLGARANTISNTGSLTYVEGGASRAVDSNTVVIDVNRQTTSSNVRFMQVAVDGGGISTPVDGGQCRMADGAYMATPQPEYPPFDPAAAPLEPASTFRVGEPVFIVLTDADRNVDAAVRDFVTVSVTTSNGDEESFRLQETDVNSGVFAGFVPTDSALPPTRYNCSLTLTDNDISVVQYADPLHDGDISEARADINAASLAGALTLEKSASISTASAGDFIRYELIVTNSSAVAIDEVGILDRLPLDMRYVAGSSRLGGIAIEDPILEAEGRSLRFAVGDMAAAASLTLTYVVQVAPGVRPGRAINRAAASNADGATSNEAEASVQISAPLFTDAFTIIGQVLDGECALDRRPGVPGIRLVMEDGTYVVTDADGRYHIEGVRPGPHVVQVDLESVPDGFELVRCDDNTRRGRRAFSQFVDGRGGSLHRADFYLRRTSQEAAAVEQGVAEAPAAAASASAASVATDADAAGADRDWFAGQSPGIAFLFPEEDHNPRAPTLRVAVKHQPGQSVVLTVSGRAADALSFDGTQTSADGTMAVSVWRGLPLAEGDNIIRARVRDASGAEVETLVRRVHYANTAARVEFVPELSRLVADGATRPVIAVRITDRAGHPVREGTTGPLHIASPYTAALDLDAQQMQQLSGIASRAPTWRVAGDDGIALIELAPTTQGGEAVLEFPFAQSSRQREVRAWLAATREDWIVVGFAAGTAGFNTLSENSVPLDEGEGSDIIRDGQLSFYASGRVRGSWLLTVAYDSERRRDDRGLLSTIDPDRYYTVYGDGTEQSYDAASRRNLYVRLERDQFYALFGDFETGLTQTELSRYSRTLTGARVEYRGNVVTFSGFAAETQDRFIRDELQGSGLSGPYQLSRREVISGSDKIILETRDRLRADRIVARRELSRHIDYDIDYAAGTIRFRQPIASRDRDFNPIFIVAEYEVFGAGEAASTAGGRAAVRLLEGAVEIGASVLSDQTDGADAELAGLDATLALGADTTIRIEAASSTMNPGGTSQDGAGFLVEAEHHTESADILAYVRQQDRGFGIGQQSLGLVDARRYGIEGSYDFSRQLSLAGNLYREEQLTGAGERTAGEAQLRYTGEDFAIRGGVQAVNDISSDGRNLESRLLTLGASRFLMDRRLEISSDVALPFGMSAESVDFPARYRAGAAYTLTDNVRLIGSYELAQGDAFESQTAQLGLDATPWTGARLTVGLNQASVPEFGPRTYALFGLSQSLPINERLTIDVALESSATISGEIPEIDRPDSDHPAAAGGYVGADARNEDFTALSLGAAYRADLWSWNGRLETRDGDMTDRFGIVTNVLRQLESGVVVGSSLRAFQSMTAEGAESTQASLDFSIAWRPLHSNWSLLNRLEFQYDALTGAEENEDTRSRRAINNFALSYDEGDTGRLMGTIHYGSKFVFARFEDQEFEGYVDVFGLEARYDLTEWLDLGLHGGVHHAWDAGQYAFTFGPSIGVSPFTNAWVTVGYNFSGFRDQDLGMTGYTDAGPYLTVRMKFDQDTFESPERAQ